MVALMFVPVVSAVASVDEQQTSGPNYTESQDGFWQSVTVDATRITKVELYMWRTCDSGVAPYRLKITSGTDPNSGVYMDQDGVYASSTTSSWTTVDFTDFSTTPSQLIYLHLRPTAYNGPWACYSRQLMAPDNPYTRGDISWGTNYDIAFKVWGDYYASTLTSGTAKVDTIFNTAGDARHYDIGVFSPNGYTNLNVKMDDSAAGTSDFDLYVRRDARPTTSTYDCRSASTSNVDECDFPSPTWGTYYIMVRRYGGSGSFTITATGSTNNPPYSPTLTSPSNGADEQASSVTLSWSSPSPADPNGDAVTYTTYFGTSNQQPPGGSISCTTSGSTRNCATSDLSWATTYYWQVKADDGKPSGVTWSARRSFTTNQYPYTPSSLVPNTATAQSLPVTLTWSGGDPDPGASPYYTVYLGTSNPPTSTVSGCVDITTASCSPTLTYSTTYYWKVKSTDRTISGSYLERESAVASFPTGTQPNNAPNSPTLNSPANGATKQSNAVSLSWDSPSPQDPDGDAVTYTTYFGTSNVEPPGSSISCSTSGSTRTCATSSLAWGTTYYWQVKADDGKTNGVTWSQRRNFLTNQYPYTPSSLSPNTNTAQGTSVTLSWSGGDPDGTTPYYTVYLGTANPPTTTVSGCVEIQTTTCTPSLSYSNTYYWKVKSSDHTISGSYLERESAVASFPTGAAPNNNPYTPGNSAPANGATSVSRTPTFTWTSSGDPDSGDTVTFTVRANSQDVCTASYPTKTCTSTVTFGKGVSVSWRVKATDNHGAISQSVSTSFTTQVNRAPTASFTWTTNGLTANFDGTGSTDPDGDPLTYTWYVPDGGQTWMYYTSTPQRTFSCDQTSAVRLQVMDTDNAWDEASHDVAVADTRDSDGDGLVRCREQAQGTSDSDRDSDDDGLSDLIESTVFVNRDAVFCNAAATTCVYPHPMEQDLYVEIDWYSDLVKGALLYSEGQLQVIRNAYANAPRLIHLVLDTGQLGGGENLGYGGNGDWDVVVTPAYQNPTTFADARRDIFHYHVVACTGGAGQGQAPGDVSVVWVCLNDSNYGQAAFLHELGHNIAGIRHIASAATQGDPNCDWRSARANPALPTHFDHHRGENDCDNNGVMDTYEHSSATDDALTGDGLWGQTTYWTDTWNAFRLDLAVGPLSPTCTDVLPYLGTVGNAIEDVVYHCVADASHMDLGPPHEERHPPAEAAPAEAPAGVVALAMVLAARRRNSQD